MAVEFQFCGMKSCRNWLLSHVNIFHHLEPLNIGEDGKFYIISILPQLKIKIKKSVDEERSELTIL